MTAITTSTSTSVNAVAALLKETHLTAPHTLTKVGTATKVKTCTGGRLQRLRGGRDTIEPREALGVRGACSRFPIATCLTTAPASWSHSKRFARFGGGFAARHRLPCLSHSLPAMRRLTERTRSASSCRMRRNRIPGFRFHVGRLMIFTEDEARIVHSWPDLGAVWKRTARSAWTPFTPRFRVLRPKLVADAETPVTDLGPTGVRSQALDPA